jgi:hypothetical protein
MTNALLFGGAKKQGGLVKRILLNSAIVVTASVAVTSTVNAQDVGVASASGGPSLEQKVEPQFGQRGQWYLYAPYLLALHTSYGSGVAPTTSYNALALSVEVGTFARNHFSLGLGVVGDYSWQHVYLDPSSSGSDKYTNWDAGLQLVAGWQRPLSSWVSFWPKVKLGGGYGAMDQSTYDVSSGEQSKERVASYAVSADLRLPLVLHVTRRLFVEVAWELHTGFVHTDQYDGYQATGQTSLGLGGWL